MKAVYFNQKIGQVEGQILQKNKILQKLGRLRLGSFMLLVFGITWGIREGSIIGYLLGIIMAVCFTHFVKQYRQAKGQLSYAEMMKKVLLRYLDRLEDGKKGWKHFKENGSDYLKAEDTVSKDLDLIGRSSLYQYLSVCHTPLGKKKLAKALSVGCQTSQEIKLRQGAVAELIEDEAFALKLQTLSGLMADDERRHDAIEGDIETFIEEAEKKKVYVGKVINLLSYVIPCITLFAIFVAGYYVLSFPAEIRPMFKVYLVPAYVIACAGIIFQLGIAIWKANENKKLLDPVFAFTKKVSVYEAFLEAIEKKDFKSEHLKALQAKLITSGSAVKGLKALKGLSAAIDVRYNVILYSFLAMLLMWDVHCKDGLSKWNEQYGSRVREWLEIIAEFEVLLSLAVLGQVKEKYCFPSMVESDTPKLSFKALAHPLISEDKVVSNSFGMEAATCIITGSNMSGKTTFLRSIGVNLKLAYAGGVVLAEHFTASRMELFTSMRVEDRVDQGISTFYAEILRIKEMVGYSKQRRPMLVLIDEIFKGTNSADRIVGAQEAIKKLGKPWCNVMVSTHDFELCHLALGDERKLVNYHFEEYYKDDHILFDYQLKEGQSQTTNAQYLLKMAGIMEEE